MRENFVQMSVVAYSVRLIEHRAESKESGVRIQERKK